MPKTILKFDLLRTTPRRATITTVRTGDDYGDIIMNKKTNEFEFHAVNDSVFSQAALIELAEYVKTLNTASASKK